jgi:hypothetical protein
VGAIGERYRGVVFVSEADPGAVLPAWTVEVLTNAGLEPAEVASVDLETLDDAAETLTPRVLIAETEAVAARLREAYRVVPVLVAARARASGAPDAVRRRRALELGLELRRLADGR